MPSIHGIEHRYDVGAEVMVRKHVGGSAAERRAIIRKHEPYRGRPGYYVSYPDATEQWHCHGGWVSESGLK